MADGYKLIKLLDQTRKEYQLDHVDKFFALEGLGLIFSYTDDISVKVRDTNK